MKLKSRSRSIQIIATAAVLSLVMATTACNVAWVATVDTILAAAAPALTNILQIIAVAEGKPYNTALASKIQADAANLKILAADFAADKGSNACQLLQSGILTYQDDQALVLQIVQVSDPNTQNKVTLLVGLVAGTVNTILALIPSCQAPASVTRAMKAGPPMSTRKFISRYNEILVAPTGNGAVDNLTPQLTIHSHAKWERVLTFGILK